MVVRARLRRHLVRLVERFPALGKHRIISRNDTDYRYRMSVPAAEWVEIVGALAEEQTWSNFKNEVAEFGGRDAYEKALHDVWETMYLLQLREKA